MELLDRYRVLIRKVYGREVKQPVSTGIYDRAYSHVLDREAHANEYLLWQFYCFIVRIRKGWLIPYMCIDSLQGIKRWQAKTPYYKDRLKGLCGEYGLKLHIEKVYTKEDDDVKKEFYNTVMGFRNCLASAIKYNSEEILCLGCNNQHKCKLAWRN